MTYFRTQRIFKSIWVFVGVFIVVAILWTSSAIDKYSSSPYAYDKSEAVNRGLSEALQYSFVISLLFAFVFAFTGSEKKKVNSESPTDVNKRNETTTVTDIPGANAPIATVNTEYQNNNQLELELEDIKRLHSFEITREQVLSIIKYAREHSISTSNEENKPLKELLISGQMKISVLEKYFSFYKDNKQQTENFEAYLISVLADNTQIETIESDEQLIQPAEPITKSEEPVLEEQILEIEPAIVSDKANPNAPIDTNKKDYLPHFVGFLFALTVILIVIFNFYPLTKSKTITNPEQANLKENNSSTEPKNIVSSTITVDTSTTALKLDFDLLNGNTKIFDFKDDDKFFGTKLSIKFSARMSSAPGDKKRTIRKFAILDDNHSEFRCVINFQPMNIISSTFQEKRVALNKKSITKNLQLLGGELHHFEIIDVVEDVFVANEPASYGEYYFENLKTDGADRINSMCRNYFFFYNGGFATVQFYLDSRSLDKTEVLQSFEGYKRVINRMINSVELYN